MTALKPPSADARLGEREFIAMMAMLMALQAMCIDSMLPALGVIASDLGQNDPNARQLVVGVFLISAGFGSLIPGALADRFGRRRVLFGSLAIYILMGLACALVTDFTMLLVARALQALGSAGLSVLPGAIIRDRFGGDRMARAMSTISVVFMIVPMLAPSFGQAVLWVANWRWIFGGMALMAAAIWVWVFLRLPETLKPEYRQRIEPGVVAANMWESATNRAAIGYVLGTSVLLGGLFGYINSAQQLVAEHYGAGESFPLFFAAMAGAMALANFSNSRIVERFGARRVSHTALLLYILVGAGQVWHAHSQHESIWIFVGLMTANMCLMGFIGANFGSIALQPFARIAGAASSLQSFLRMVIGSVLGSIVGAAFNDTAQPLAYALFGFGLTALGLVLFSEKGRLFRRITPPGVARPVPDPGLH